MKKIITIFLILALVLPLASCVRDDKEIDAIAEGFLSAFLMRNEEGMKNYIHPDHLDSAMPGDEFYKALEKQYLKVGNDFTELYVVSKENYKEIRGATKCSYVARINELFYSVDLIIINDKNGAGVASFAMVFNNNPDYYYNEYLEKANA